MDSPMHQTVTSMDPIKHLNNKRERQVLPAFLHKDENRWVLLVYERKCEYITCSQSAPSQLSSISSLIFPVSYGMGNYKFRIQFLNCIKNV